MMQIKTPKTLKARRAIEKRAPKLVENGKKTLILHGTKTSGVMNSVLTEIFHLKRDNAVKYSKRNNNIHPFEAGGETSLEFFSLKTDCSLFVYGSHSKKRPNNLVLGRTYDHHVYDLIELGVENFKSMEEFEFEKRLAPKIGSKPFFSFVGDLFETSEELGHLKEVLLDLFRGEVVESLNLTGIDRVFVVTALSPTRILMQHCAIRLRRSGTQTPRMELLEVGPSMDFVVRRHRLPGEPLKKEALKNPDKTKKLKNVSSDVIKGTTGRIYMPDQELEKMQMTSKVKGLKRERREARQSKKESNEDSKKRKTESKE